MMVINVSVLAFMNYGEKLRTGRVSRALVWHGDRVMDELIN
jgi:hypothetical protein